MVITDIVPIDKKRDKIYLDGEFAFPLYKGEVFSLSIELNKEMAEDVYRQIIQDILPKRCKMRAMHLLEKRQYTRYKLEQKLVEGLYPPEIIQVALDYVESFHYIDDELYVRDYLLSEMNHRSEKDIIQRLGQKGIDKETYYKVKASLEEDGLIDDEVELEQIRKLLFKKGYNSQLEYQDKQRIMAYLFRKGYNQEKIRKVVDNFDWE